MYWFEHNQSRHSLWAIEIYRTPLRFESVPCSHASMVLDELKAQLQKNFSTGATAGLDATFCLAIHRERLTFRIREQTLEFSDLGSVDATFRFHDVDAAEALLSGKQDVVNAFMKGQFSSDGYLTWTFVLLAMFRESALQ